MAAVTRLGDFCSGHGCYPPRPNDEASSDVFVNGLGVHRLGDHWVVHCCQNDCHDGVAATGSPTVFVNGQPAVRIGDFVSCGSVSAQGSPRVFFG
jgi:uncharacterized Zn-binding protein involved in type VI secretion